MKIHELKQRGLSLDKLLAFLAVARSGSVVQAAAGVESRRSLMSRQIGELESTLGVDLFMRKGKSLQITSAGKELALLAAAFVDELEALTSRFSGDKGILKIGAGAAVLEALVYPAIRNLRRAMPEYRFDFVPDSTEGVARKLHDGRLDVGIVRSSFEDSSIERWPCGSMDFVLVGRRDFDSNITEWSVIQFLHRVPMALIRGEGDLITTLHSIIKKSGVQMAPTCLVDTFGHVKQLLVFGHPGGVLPRAMAASLSNQDFCIIDDDCMRDLDRSLSLVIDKRAARVRDKLEGIARTFAKSVVVSD